MAECILMKTGNGATSSDCTATADDVLAGTTAIYNGSDDEAANGGMVDYSDTTKTAVASLDSSNSRLQLKIPATGKYSTASKLCAAYSTICSLIGLTASKLASGVSILGLTGSYKGIGTATTDKVLEGYTFSSASLSGATGTMTNRNKIDSTIGAISSYYPNTAIHEGDVPQVNTPTKQSTPWVGIRVADGYYNGQSYVGVPQDTMASGISLTAAKLISGQTCLGITGTGKPTIAQISAIAYRGLNDNNIDDMSEEASYTCPAAGTCYYNGSAYSENSRNTVTCEIYKNGTLVDSRNIDSDNSYVSRVTMVGQSFSVAAGDVIKIVAAVTYSSTTYAKVSHIDATIVTYS